jgi:signal recognition particle subunit SRP54
VGVGEKIPDLEPFHPDRAASLILGMGDVLSLIEKAQEAIDQEEASALLGRLQKGAFTLDDFRVQLRNLHKIGSIESVLSMVPGLGKLKKLREATPDPNEITRITAIIDSMTIAERLNQVNIDGSRRKRIAKGSGTTVADVNQLLKNFAETLKMLKQVNRGGMGAMRRLFQ